MDETREGLGEEGDPSAHVAATHEPGDAVQQYYCKYCDTSWPYTHFRNAQQFGAHCSNCSRKRKVKDPQDLTIRERNKRIRKARTQTTGSKRATHSVFGEEDDEGEPEDGLDQADEAHKSRSSWSTEDWDERYTEEEQNAGFSVGTTREGPRHSAGRSRIARSIVRSAPRSRNRSLARPKAQGMHSSKGSTMLDTQEEMESLLALHDDDDDHEASRSKSEGSEAEEEEPQYPEHLTGLLMAVEKRLAVEAQQVRVGDLRSQLQEMRNEVQDHWDMDVDQLRQRATGLMGTLRHQNMNLLDALKLDLAHELATRDARNNNRVHNVRIQMHALQRILHAARHDRENSPLPFRANFDAAVKQLDEVKSRVGKDLTAREQTIHEEMGEARSSCLQHLQAAKQRVAEELDSREMRMQKDLDDIQLTLHEMCAQIAVDNYLESDNATSSDGLEPAGSSMLLGGNAEIKNSSSVTTGSQP